MYRKKVYDSNKMWTNPYKTLPSVVGFIDSLQRKTNILLNFVLVSLTDDSVSFTYK